MSYNPFTVLPITQCGNVEIPALAQCQDTTTYLQLRAQVSGLLILPIGATPPDDWETANDWAGAVDNSTTDNSTAKYLVGRGSFLPNGVVEVNLAGGRAVETREHFYRLAFSVLNTNDGHADFARKLQRGIRDFDMWVQTVGDRIIGGPEGMRPYFVNADFLFSEGNNDRETILITMDFAFDNFPDMTTIAVDLNGTPIGAGGGGGTCDCDIQALLNDLPTYSSDTEAGAGGLDVGDFYIAGAGHDRADQGSVTTRLI